MSARKPYARWTEAEDRVMRAIIEAYPNMKPTQQARVFQEGTKSDKSLDTIRHRFNAHTRTIKYVAPEPNLEDAYFSTYATLPEAQAVWGIKLESLRIWINKGKLPALRLDGKSWLIDITVMDMLHDCLQPGRSMVDWHEFNRQQQELIHV